MKRLEDFCLFVETDAKVHLRERETWRFIFIYYLLISNPFNERFIKSLDPNCNYNNHKQIDL